MRYVSHFDADRQYRWRLIAEQDEVLAHSADGYYRYAFPIEGIMEKTAYLQSLAVNLSAAARRTDALAPRLHEAAIHAAAGEEAMTFGAFAGVQAEVEAVFALVGAAEALCADSD